MTDIIIDYYGKSENYKSIANEPINYVTNKSVGASHIFINKMLSILGKALASEISLLCMDRALGIDFIEYGTKSTYFYKNYTINYMCDSDYLYLKVTCHGTIIKIIITKLMYSINFVENENIILATHGTIYNMLQNEKICTDLELYYKITTEIYNYYINCYAANLIPINYKKVDSVLGLYCLENKTVKDYKYIVFANKYDTDEDIIGQSGIFGRIVPNNEHICYMGDIVKNISIKSSVMSLKCYVSGLYLNTEIYDDEKIISKYSIPLWDHNINYYIEKQYGANGTNYSLSISDISGIRNGENNINSFFQILKNVNKRILDVYVDDCNPIIKVYQKKIFDISSRIINLMKENISNMLDILSKDINSLESFCEDIFAIEDLSVLFKLLFSSPLDKKVLFAVKILGDVILDDIDCKKMVHEYNDLFNDDINEDYDENIFFIKYHFIHEYSSNSYHYCGTYQDIFNSKYYYAVNFIINKMANYFIDFYENVFFENTNTSVFKNIYENITYKKRDDILNLYNSDQVDTILEYIVRYRRDDLYDIIYDEELYWSHDKCEEYYDFAINHLYKMETVSKYKRNVYDSFNENDLVHYTENDYSTSVTPDKCTVNKKEKYCVVYEYGKYIKYILVEYGNSCFKSSNTKIEKESKTTISITNETIENDILEYVKFNNEKTKNLVITKNLMKKNRHGINGYKAGITSSGKPCIIELRIFPKSIVAFDKKLDKYRTDICSVKNIYKVNIKETDNQIGYKIEHCIPIHTTTIDGLCSICCSNEATQVAYPCQHNLCLECWMSILLPTSRNKCPYCRQNIERIDYVPNKNIMDIIDRYETAYSFVSTHRMEYKIGETIEVKDFDPDINSACKSGIHFHLDVKDTYKWFEYLLIPDALRTDTYDDNVDNIYVDIKKTNILNDLIDNINNEIKNGDNCEDDNEDSMYYEEDEEDRENEEDRDDEEDREDEEDEILLYNNKRQTNCDYEELVIEEE